MKVHTFQRTNNHHHELLCQRFDFVVVSKKNHFSTLIHDLKALKSEFTSCTWMLHESNTEGTRVQCKRSPTTNIKVFLWKNKYHLVVISVLSHDCESVSVTVSPTTHWYNIPLCGPRHCSKLTVIISYLGLFIFSNRTLYFTSPMACIHCKILHCILTIVVFMSFTLNNLCSDQKLAAFGSFSLLSLSPLSTTLSLSHVTKHTKTLCHPHTRTSGGVYDYTLGWA